MTGSGGATTATGGATTGTGGMTTGGPDAGAPDAPVDAGNMATYYISVSPARLLDLVFMIDNSPGMAPNVVKMNAQFPKLIEALRDPNDNTLPDLRIAILDSDLGTGNQYTSGSCGPKRLPDGTLSAFGDMGRFQMINATACGVTSPDATYLETKGNNWLNFTGDINKVFACLAGNVGDDQGCGEEHQLQAFEFAFVVSGLGAVNDEQRKMLRANAYLGLVFLTDEDDCSAAPNDAMFGDRPELRGESASLRCYSRSHACNGQNLTQSPPGYPTSAAFSAALTSCQARVGDTCDTADVSQPTACNPLRDIKVMADEIKALKEDPASQILVAGIFGWPLSDADMATAQYKIDLIPNPNTADTAHPTVFDSWPVCYDPNHRPANPNVYDPVAAGWGATAGLREAAYIDEFGPNGLKFSICQTDFAASMKTIGDSIGRKLQNLCIHDKLADADPATPGLQPDCRVVYRTPAPDPRDPTKVVYQESPTSLPWCPAGATSRTITEDCWQLARDLTKCPDALGGQMLNLLRIDQGPLPAGTQVAMQCHICTADQVEGCSY
jgi:hypothetical protein